MSSLDLATKATPPFIYCMQVFTYLSYLYNLFIHVYVLYFCCFLTLAELRSMQEKMLKLQQQLEVSQKCVAVSRPKLIADNISSQKSTKSSPKTQQNSTLTSPQHSSRQVKSKQCSKTPQRDATAFSSPKFTAAELPGKPQNKQKTAHHPKTGRQLSSLYEPKTLPSRVVNNDIIWCQ